MALGSVRPPFIQSVTCGYRRARVTYEETTKKPLCSFVSFVVSPTLPHKPVHQPHNEAQHDAQQNARRDWEEERGVLAAVADVARQSSEGDIHTAGDQGYTAEDDQQSACDDQ